MKSSEVRNSHFTGSPSLIARRISVLSLSTCENVIYGFLSA